MDMLLNPITSVPLLSMLALAIWVAVGLRYIMRVIRYFQIEEYKPNRFLAVLIRLREERFYWGGLLLLAIIIVGDNLQSSRELTINMGRGAAAQWLLGPILLATLFAAFGLWPWVKLGLPKREPGRGFNPTPRARRLLAVSLGLVTFPAAVVLALYLLAVATRAPIDLLQVVQVTALTGVLSAAFVPLAIPLADLLLWPVEAATRRYYLRLAAQNLARSNARVIALTGSYGKTSTKHYLQHLLEQQFRSLMTPRSFNTLLGVSRSINELLAGNTQYDYFIVEAGAYIPGEIARICQLVKPQISIVTAVGPMHLERFGTIENIVKAKYEIIEALPADGLGVFNGDDVRVRGMAERGYPQQQLLITQQGLAGARFAASEVEMFAAGTRFRVTDTVTHESMVMDMPLFGEHNISNVLLAIAVAHHVGMSLDSISYRVQTLKPADHRLVRTVLPNGWILIDDAYSANPIGTQMALKVLTLQGSQRRVVVSSGMFELGDLHDQENRLLGERIAAAATDVILIGEAQVAPLKAGLISKGYPTEHLHVVNTLDEAIAIYRGILQAGDSLLLLTDLPDTYR